MIHRRVLPIVHVADRIADDILSVLDTEAMEKASALKDDTTRCGMYGSLLRFAVQRANISMYRSSPYWYDPIKGFWVSMEDKDLSLACLRTIERCGISESDLFSREKRLKEMMTDSVYFSSLQPRKDLICFKNCVLDLSTMQSFQHSPQFPVIYRLEYDYDQSRSCPLWDSFLEQVLPEPECRMVLQEYLGQIFLDRTKVKLEKMLYLLGTGSNGKSVVFETINGILGATNVSNYDMQKLIGKSESCSYNIAEMDGKLLNYCSDVDKKELNGDALKGIISGEPVMARLPYKDPFKASNLPPMMANANALPPTSDHSKGYYRRMLVIPFKITIPDNQQDKELHVKLRAEFPGILNWILAGRDRFVDQSYQFTTSREIENGLREHRIENNSILSYLRFVGYFPFVTYSGQKESKIDLQLAYDSYVTFCTKTGSKPFSMRAFNSTLKDRDFDVKRSNGRTFIYYFETLTFKEYLKYITLGLGTMTRDEYATMCSDAGYIDETGVEDYDDVMSGKRTIQLNVDFVAKESAMDVFADKVENDEYSMFEPGDEEESEEAGISEITVEVPDF